MRQGSRPVRRRWIAWVGVVLASGWVVGLPRVVAYPDLVDDNLRLRRMLQEVELQLDEADVMLQRLRLYDAELRALVEPRGDHGPIPKGTGKGVVDEPGDIEALEEALGVVASQEPPPSAPPAEAWSRDVSERLGRFVDLFRLSEPDLNALVADLETLRAVREALPTIWPADGVFTSGFGWRRDPYRRGLRFHSGIDIAGAYGTPIRASAAGSVSRSTRTSGYGNVIEIDHGFGIMTRYAHLTHRRVQVGQVVERGDVIGTMGSTGRSTGPHLHFELHVDGNTLDPLPYLPR